MPEIGTATVKVVPDLTEVEQVLAAQASDGARIFFNVLSILLLVCSPAFVALAYKAAF